MTVKYKPNENVKSSSKKRCIIRIGKKPRDHFKSESVKKRTNVVHATRDRLTAGTVLKDKK